MKYKIIHEAGGLPAMSWDEAEDISTNVFLAFNIKKGSLFSRPDFGIDLSDIKKVTDNNIVLIKDRLIGALQWLLILGKAKAINIIVEKDLKNISRVNYKAEITQADGIPITVNNFVTVGGSS